MNLYAHAVIIAGGKSSRMGKDKALLPFGKETNLTEYQYKKLKKLFHTVFISAKENKFDFDCHIITDVYHDTSPLVGIISIFETLKEVDAIFILSVDAPFVDKIVIDKIMEEKDDNADVIIAKSPAGVQPLCGLYKKSILSLAYTQYQKGNHKLQDLLALAQSKTIHFKEDTPFTNLNHPKEYEEALKIKLN